MGPEGRADAVAADPREIPAGRIMRAEVQRFAVPLRVPLATAAGRVGRREGFLLRLADDAGRVGHGEASPAYWIGDEELATTAAVVAGAPALVGHALADLPAIVAAWGARSPAAACALDSARLDLAARAAGVPLARLLRPAGDAWWADAGVPVAALLAEAAPDALAGETARLVAAGYRTLKLKVGAGALAADVARLAAVRAAAGPGVEVRLDANRAWSAAAADAALAALAPYAPALVEEPLRSGDLPAWRGLRRRGVPLARDESVRTVGDCERLAAGTDVLVVKAARAGGPAAVAALAAAARRHGLGVVVTDSIETRVGRALALHLAAAFSAPGVAVGLGGARLLAAEPAGGPPAAAPLAIPRGPGLGI